MTKFVQLFSGLPQDQYCAKNNRQTSFDLSCVQGGQGNPFSTSNNSAFFEWAEFTRVAVKQCQTLTRALTDDCQLMAAFTEGKKLPGFTFPEEAGIKINMYTNT